MLSKYKKFRVEKEQGDMVVNIAIFLSAALIVGAIIFAISIFSGDKSSSDSTENSSPRFATSGQREGAVDSRAQSDMKNAVSRIEEQIVKDGMSAKEKELVESTPNDSQIQINRSDIYVDEGNTITIKGTNLHYQVIVKNENGGRSGDGNGFIYDSAAGGMQQEGVIPDAPEKGEIISLP